MKHTIVPPRDVKTIPRYETGLIVHNVESKDFGEYQCYITNQFGTAFATIRLEQQSISSFFSHQLRLNIVLVTD